MRKTKAYKDFQIVKESVGFGNSEEYRVLGEMYNKLNREYFQEHFYDITDENIVDFNYYTYIGNDKQSIGWNDLVDTSADHYIYYGINLRPKNESINTNSVSSFEGLKRVSDNINKIINSVKEFEGRIQNDGLIITQTSVNTGGVTPSHRAITLTVRGSKINKDDLKKYYDMWKLSKGPNYDKGMTRLREEYSKNGITNVDLDTNEDIDQDIIHIGFMMLDDEIISVATYSKKNDDFDIDWSEFRRSIREYRRDNQ